MKNILKNFVIVLLVVIICGSVIAGLKYRKNIVINSKTPISLSAPAPVNKILITCISRLDNDKVIYYSTNDHQVESPLMPGLIIHYIIETNGVHITLNQTELNNYSCTTQQINVQ